MSHNAFNNLASEMDRDEELRAVTRAGRRASAVPAQSFEFVCEWFGRAGANAKAQGKLDAAALWADGLEQLEFMQARVHELATELQALVDYADALHRFEESEEGRDVDYETFPSARAALAKATA